MIIQGGFSLWRKRQNMKADGKKMANTTTENKKMPNGMTERKFLSGIKNNAYGITQTAGDKPNHSA